MSSGVTCKSVIVSTLFFAHFFAAFTWLKVDAIIPSNKYILHFAESYTYKLIFYSSSILQSHLCVKESVLKYTNHGVNICKLVKNSNGKVRVNSHSSGSEYRLVYQMQHNAVSYTPPCIPMDSIRSPSGLCWDYLFFYRIASSLQLKQ